MSVVISSTTSSQKELDHAASENWRTPPEPEPEASVVTPEAEEQTETAGVPETPEETESEQPKRKGGWQRKIDKLTKRTATLESENAELRARLVKPAETVQPEPQAPQKPKADDFKTVEDYVAALVKWERIEADKQEAQQAEADAMKEAFNSYHAKVAEARAEYDDFDEVVGQAIQIPSAVQLAIIEMDNGPDVAYHLGNHPEVCEELVGMRPLSAVRAIERISATLSKGKVSSQEPKPRPTPPPPVRPVGGASARSSIPLDQLSPLDYIKVRNQQERERGRR